MNFIKKVFWSNKTLLLTEFAFPTVCLLFSFIILQFNISATLLEGLFYIVMILTLIVIVLVAVKSIYIVFFGIKHKNLSFKNVGLVLLYIFLGVLMYYETLFSGLLLVGFS